MAQQRLRQRPVEMGVVRRQGAERAEVEAAGHPVDLRDSHAGQVERSPVDDFGQGEHPRIVHGVRTDLRAEHDGLGCRGGDPKSRVGGLAAASARDCGEAQTAGYTGEEPHDHQ